MIDRRRLCLSIYTGLAVIAALGFLLYAIPAAQQSMKAFPFDGWVDWIGARAYFTHSNPFDPTYQKSAGLSFLGFGHPPTTPFWFLPIWDTEVQMMSLIVGQFTTLMLIGAMLIVCHQLATPAPIVTAVLLFGATLSSSWMLDHLSMAQISMLICFLYTLAWTFLRRRHDVLAGLCLGLACTLKLFPGILVGLLLVTRRWKAFFTACGAYLVVAIVMTARYGLICWSQFFKQQGATADFWASNVRNGSLHGIMLRLAHPSCTRGGPTTTLTTLATAFIALALLAGAWWLTRNALKQHDRLDLGFMLFAVISAFVNPWVWEHYNVFLIAPVVLCVMTLVAERRRGLGLGWFAAAMVLIGVVLGALAVDMAKKSALQIAYQRDHSGHLALHFYEVVNWLPWVVMIGMLMALQRRSNRQAASP